MPNALWALIVLLIYLVPFVLLGWLVRHAAGRWIVRRGLDAADRPDDRARGAGGRRFLLGAWFKD